MGKAKKSRSSSTSEDDSSSSGDESSSDSSRATSPSPEKKSRKSSDSSSKKKRKKEKKKAAKEKKKRKKLEKKAAKEALKDVPTISIQDYYARNAEFRRWILSNRKISETFSDMDTKKAKSLFKKFVRKWNDKKLSAEIYFGNDAARRANDAAFQWGFAQNMDSKTKSEIDAAKNDDGVGNGKMEKMVSKNTEAVGRASTSTSSKRDGGPKETDPGPKVIGPVLPAHIAQNRESSSEDEQEAFERKMSEKRYRDYVKTAEDELCPRATGHEARLEKKALARERKRQRDTSPGLSDKVLLGDSSRMGKAIESRKQERTIKQEKSSSLAREKLAAYAEREKAKMEALLEMAKASKKEGALW